MNNSRLQGVVWLTACALLSGCFGVTAHPVRPEVQVRAETQLMRGIRAEQKGNALEAERLLSESLQLSASIEDNPAKARARINLARLYRLQPDMARARASIDAALGELETESDDYAEAAQEKALIELPADSAAALVWAEKGVATEKGTLLGRRLNLLGRIQMARGDATTATLTLKQALDRNRDGGLAEEEANSLRMLGILARGQQRFGDAERLLTEALEIDKRIGVSTKVAIDLEELSATALASGATDKAIACLRRASEVNLGSGRSRQAAANLTTLAEICRSAGRMQEAEEALKAAEGLERK
jgi:tetratricopeptide (TPR) repeat protein